MKPRSCDGQTSLRAETHRHVLVEYVTDEFGGTASGLLANARLRSQLEEGIGVALRVDGLILGDRHETPADGVGGEVALAADKVNQAADARRHDGQSARHAFRNRKAHRLVECRPRSAWAEREMRRTGRK